MVAPKKGDSSLTTEVTGDGRRWTGGKRGRPSANYSISSQTTYRVANKVRREGKGAEDCRTTLVTNQSADLPRVAEKLKLRHTRRAGSHQYVRPGTDFGSQYTSVCCSLAPQASTYSQITANNRWQSVRKKCTPAGLHITLAHHHPVETSPIQIKQPTRARGAFSQQARGLRTAQQEV